MDKNVIAALARWPDVPDVFGWLSLTEQGHWRIHPQGDATLGKPGEPITSPQILHFMDRNYSCDTHGQWFFQNGPQRVFVRLDAAPYILRTTSQPLALQTHTGVDVTQLDGWWLDDSGKLYAQTEHGPGLIAGRDAMSVLEALYTNTGQPLTSQLEQMQGLLHAPLPVTGSARTASDNSHYNPQHALHNLDTVLLKFCPASDIPRELGFILQPQKI